ncbi:hypothetical protein HOE22_11380 [Candidatus Woesearchaeota archaeon]|jgi:hypothetical protein|nr:hypothetical protein [Candidatus Woesearchaeota archaeon]MBT7558470.1 hypothetical protein [Candidatus Woesearchaeota archaeon]
MNEWILFTIGIFTGSLGGIMTMALMSANKLSRMNNIILDLKEQIRTNQYSKPKPRKYRKKA